MAKRFTDTEKYKDPWFRKLTPMAKTLFLFMCDDCNHAGIWKENLETFNFVYKSNATYSNIEEFGDKVIKIDNDTYLIHSFIKFQYGMLNPDNKAHFGVIRALSYAGIDYKQYVAPSKALGSSQGIGTGNGEGKEAGIGKRNSKGKVAAVTVDDVPF